MALPPFAPATTGVELRQRRQALPLSRRSRHRQHSLSARTPNFSPDPRPTPGSMHRCNRRPQPCWIRPTAPDPATDAPPSIAPGVLAILPGGEAAACAARSGRHRQQLPPAGFPATVPPAGCSDAACPPRPFQATLDEAGRLDTVAGEPQPSSRAAAGARRWRCGPYRRSRRSSYEPGWCGPGRPTRDGAAVAGAAWQPPTACRGQAPARERS